MDLYDNSIVFKILHTEKFVILDFKCWCSYFMWLYVKKFYSFAKK